MEIDNGYKVSKLELGAVIKSMFKREDFRTAEDVFSEILPWSWAKKMLIS